MSIQRYEIWDDNKDELDKFEFGSYVTHTDHLTDKQAALDAQQAAHAGEVERLKGERDAYRACLDGLEMREMDKMATEGPAMAAAIGSEMSRVIKSIIAARDAAIRERDEAVEALHIVLASVVPHDKISRDAVKKVRAALAKIEGGRNGC